MRHNRIAINECNTVEYGCVSLRMRFFPQNFGTIKRILPGSSSPSYREGPGIEVEIMCTCYYVGVRADLRAIINTNFVLEFIYFTEENRRNKLYRIFLMLFRVVKEQC